jgi:hypothetical protein
MLKAQKSLKQKNLKILYSWRSFFSIFFASGLFPYNDAFLTYSAKRKKIQKCRSYETWAVEILPPERGKIGPAMSRPPPVLPWHSVQRGGGRGPLTWQPIAQT